MCLDMEMWRIFLHHPSVFARPFIDFTKELNSVEIQMTSDVAGRVDLGMGSICKDQWSYQQWDTEFMTQCNPSIEYLELYAVLNGVLLWINQFKNQRITLFCDNESVVEMINSSSSTCKNCMVLIRMLVLKSLVENVRISEKHILGKSNFFSDALSHLDIQHFHDLALLNNRTFAMECTPVHESIWPMTKLWLY